MSVETEEDLAVFFNADEFGEAAEYTPPGGGAAVSCTVLLERADRQVSGTFGRPLMRGNTISVRSAEIAAPAKSGTFVIDGESFTIESDPESIDPDRKVWTCTVEPTVVEVIPGVMFGASYFGPRYFGGRYFGQGA